MVVLALVFGGGADGCVWGIRTVLVYVKRE